MGNFRTAFEKTRSSSGVTFAWMNMVCHLSSTLGPILGDLVRPHGDVTGEDRDAGGNKDGHVDLELEERLGRQGELASAAPDGIVHEPVTQSESAGFSTLRRNLRLARCPRRAR